MLDNVTVQRDLDLTAANAVRGESNFLFHTFFLYMQLDLVLFKST
jgi:hypothetical protein